MHVYKITSRGGEVRLVAAKNRARALAYAAKTHLAVTLASAMETAELVGAGVQVEQATAKGGGHDDRDQGH